MDKKEDVRNRIFQVRVNNNDLQNLRKAAQNTGGNVSEFVRELARCAALTDGDNENQAPELASDDQ